MYPPPVSVSKRLTRDLLFVAGGKNCYWKGPGASEEYREKSHLSMPGLLWTSVTDARSTVLPRSSTPLEHDRMRAPNFHLRHHFTQREGSVFQKLSMRADTGGWFEERVVWFPSNKWSFGAVLLCSSGNFVFLEYLYKPCFFKVRDILFCFSVRISGKSWLIFGSN